MSDGAAAGAQSMIANESPSSEPSANKQISEHRLGLGRRAVRREAMVHHEASPIGDDVAGDAPLDQHRLHCLAVLASVDHGPPFAVVREPRRAPVPRRWIALRPIHGRAVWARAPPRTTSARIVP